MSRPPFLLQPRSVLAWSSLLALTLLGCPDSSGGGGGSACPREGALCACDRGTGRIVCMGEVGMCHCVVRDAAPDGGVDPACEPTGDERCNGRDDDCDGVIDELAGVCQQAGTCFAGRPACAERQPPTADAVVCRDGTGVDRPVSGEELCSGIDDDCDGRVDEGYDLDSDPQHCGGCGHDCAAPLGVALEGASFACEAGACRVEACGAGREDRDGDPGNGCECAPGRLDRPDPLFGDADCDDRLDEDIELDTAVFVDAAAGPGGDGSPLAPLAELREAITAAETAGRRQVILAVGAYDLHPGLDEEDLQRQAGLVVPDGLWLRGGFVHDGPDWYRPLLAGLRTVVTGASPTLHYTRLTRTTVLEGVDVAAAIGLDGRITDAGSVSGTGSIAILAEDVGEHLLIANSLVESEDAGRGYRGGAGASGRVGGDGGRPGEPASLDDCPFPETPLRCGGQRGITRRCEPAITVPVGGDGGDAERAGAAGAAAVGVEPARGGGSGRAGQVGLIGAAGRTGAASGLMGRITAEGRWVPELATDGLAGRPGNGGGGGGGTLIYGGGGGGGGGCPGQPGTAAEGGQASFALVVRGGRVHVVDAPDGDRPGHLTLRARRGGPGGTAGRGGAGGIGGRGAVGEPAEGACPGCTAGGAGGNGGRGGCGGHGGAGAGGPAFAVLRVPPVGGALNESRLVFLQPVGDPSDPASRRVFDDPALGVEAYLETLGGGSGGRAADGQECPATATDGPEGLAGAVGCCVSDAQGRCAPLGPCAP